MPTHHDETTLQRYEREAIEQERFMAQRSLSPEFRAQQIKTRLLEITSTLAEMKRAYVVEGVDRPFTVRVTLEAEQAALALEQRQIGDAAAMAKVIRRKLENADLLAQLREVLHERGLDDAIEEAQRRSNELLQSSPT